MTKEYYFREGCYITEYHNTDLDPESSIAQARVEIGATTQWHTLENTSERYLILEGKGLAEKGDNSAVTLVRGDVFLIPPGTKQRIKNIGDCDLIFLAICTPRFVESNYISLDG